MKKSWPDPASTAGRTGADISSNLTCPAVTDGTVDGPCWDWGALGPDALAICSKSARTDFFPCAPAGAYSGSDCAM